MFSRNPFLLLCVFWMLLPSLPTSAQHSSASTVKHTSKTKKHTPTRHAKKAAVSKSIKVWVNTNSGVYHYPGQRWYGNTREGEYMSEDEARKRGFRATQNGQ
jgi:hypothetical protein